MKLYDELLKLDDTNAVSSLVQLCVGNSLCNKTRTSSTTDTFKSKLAADFFREAEDG